MILIEAKRIDDHTERDENWEQVHDYMLEVPAAGVVVVTNRKYWAMQVRNESGDWEPESDRPLGLHWRDTDETADRLVRHLDRSKHRSGLIQHGNLNRPRETAPMLDDTRTTLHRIRYARTDHP